MPRRRQDLAEEAIQALLRPAPALFRRSPVRKNVGPLLFLSSVTPR